MVLILFNHLASGPHKTYTFYGRKPIMSVSGRSAATPGLKISGLHRPAKMKSNISSKHHRRRIWFHRICPPLGTAMLVNQYNAMSYVWAHVAIVWNAKIRPTRRKWAFLVNLITIASISSSSAKFSQFEQLYNTQSVAHCIVLNVGAIMASNGGHSARRATKSNLTTMVFRRDVAFHFGGEVEARNF